MNHKLPGKSPAAQVRVRALGVLPSPLNCHQVHLLQLLETLCVGHRLIEEGVKDQCYLLCFGIAAVAALHTSIAG